MIENKSNVYQRLIRHMEINKTTGCWEWQGSKRNGYGRMTIGSRTTETAEPQPDGIQVRTVDDLGRICIPKDIRDKLGIKPGTECAVFSMDELTPDEIIVIRRNKNDKH